MKKTMKILAWYNILLMGLLILLNINFFLQGSDKFKADILLMCIPILIFMIMYLREQQIFMKILAWYTLIVSAFNLFIYIIYSGKDVWTLIVTIALTPLIVFPILYFKSQKQTLRDKNKF